MTRTQDETIGIYAGIDINTHEVKKAWVTRGGKISVGMHSVDASNKNIVAELLIIYSISDTQFIPIHLLNTDFEKAILTQLQALADEQKKQRICQLRE